LGAGPVHVDHWPRRFQGDPPMSDLVSKLRQTTGAKHILAPRLLAGLPLLGIGVMHITGSAPLKPILEGAGIPMAHLNSVVAPIVEIVAGLLILSGALTRVGAAMAMGTMAVALYTHMAFEATETFAWEDEPPIVLPIVVLLSAIYLLWRGGGAWSLDGKGSSASE
jgi:putative oxidoreductase